MIMTVGLNDKGIQFISPIFIPLQGTCGYCKNEVLLEFVVSYGGGFSYAVCLACRNQIIANAGVHDDGENVVVFSAK